MNLLSERQSFNIDEKFILKLTNFAFGLKNFKKEIQSFCKVFHFSSKWNLIEVLGSINGLDPKDYPQAFIFIIEIKSYALVKRDIDKLKEILLRFGINRVLLLQLIFLDENIINFYYKEETSNFLDASLPTSNLFESFFNSFFGDQFNGSEIEILDFLADFQNRSIILRFLNTLNLSAAFFGSLILDIATNGTKFELFSALDAPFGSDGRILNIRAQKYISDVFGDDDDSENDDSVLLRALQNNNFEVTNYFITYCSHLIQQLPFDHQIKISTVAFNTNQLDVLCDLLEFVDYPFPKNFKIEAIDHDRLLKTIEERTQFKIAIEAENYTKINDFINNNPNLKLIFDSSNNSALTVALNAKKFSVFYYLKSLGFKGEMCDNILQELSDEDRKTAIKQSLDQRKKNINESLANVQKAVHKLSMQSFIHNKKISKAQQKEYRQKITKWLSEIHEVAPELLDVAASCDNLKIIFDFESDSVENVSLSGSNAAGTTYPVSKWIFIGAKLSDKSGNVIEKREQKIKGVLAHELCHYIMRLVYENQENPYHAHRNDLKEIFDAIVQEIDKWSSENSDNPDDECNGIISSVFKLYANKDFHPEVIVRVVQILTEFDDDKGHVDHLKEMYKSLFDFWRDHVIPELQNFLLRNKDAIKFNRLTRLMDTILNTEIEVKLGKDIDKLVNSKLVVVLTNHSKILFADIFKNLNQKFGKLIDSKNLFTDIKELNNPQIWDEFKQIIIDNLEMNVFINCSKGVSESLVNFIANKEQNFIFVVTVESQSNEFVEICDKKEIKNYTKMELNYNWSNLTEESQKFLLDIKINFQNNSEITLKDLLMKDSNQDQLNDNKNGLNELIDDHLLSMILENKQIYINRIETEDTTENLQTLLYCPRKIIKKFRIDGEMKEQKILETELFTEVKNKQFVLISDIAGNGKSSMMKNATKLLREKNPVNWVTYVDLKEFIDEYKAQMAQEEETEFTTFMIEKILKLKLNFEAKIFRKLYDNGKIYILFDGFDEIAPTCAEFVLKLIKNFNSNGGNQLWIATRDYFEINLMNQLKIDIAYSFKEMTEIEGIDLIAKNWVLKDLKNVPKSREEIEECIAMSTNYEIYRQKAGHIIKKAAISNYKSVGLPQLFKMIVDGFKDEKNIDDLQGIKIYAKFIKILYKKWSEEKGQIRNEASIDSQEFELNFYRFHQYHAVLIYCPEIIELLFPDCDESEWKEEEVIACGIMTLKNGKFSFIHQTFQEYFVADVIAKALKKSKIKDKVLEIFIKILNSYGTTRMFLNDMINDDSILAKIQPQIIKYVDKFYKMRRFEEYFINNYQKLIDLVIEVLKSGNYDQVKKILHNCARNVAEKTKEPIIFEKFQQLFIDFLNVEDCKKLITDNFIFYGIVKSGADMEIFDNFLIKAQMKTDLEFVRNELSKFVYGRNSFCSLTLSSKLKPEKISKFLTILEKIFNFSEIFEMIRNCTDDKLNVLQVCIDYRARENIVILWTEIEKFFSIQNRIQSFKELLRQRDRKGRSNILHFFVYCEDIKFHKTLWQLLFNTFTNLEDLMPLILKDLCLVQNFVHELVRANENSVIIEWSFKMFKEKFNKNQFREILESKGPQGWNLLHNALMSSKPIEVCQILWMFFENEDILLNTLKERDIFGRNVFHFAALKSSTSLEFFVNKLGINKRVEIAEMLMNIDNFSQNLLFAVAFNNSFEEHEILWKILQKCLDDSKILQLIKYISKDGNNVLFIAVTFNTKETVELTWNQIKTVLTYEKQKEFLKLKGQNDKSLIECALSNEKYKSEVYEWLKCCILEYEKPGDSN